MNNAVNDTASDKPVIGFIGVGLMGHGMAKNIVTKGYPLAVLGYRNRSPVKRLSSLVATEAGWHHGAGYSAR